MTKQIDTLARFLEYAADAENWNGQPMVGGNVGGDPADKGFLLNMKKNGWITTDEDDDTLWMNFTDKGKEVASEYGLVID